MREDRTRAILRRNLVQKFLSSFLLSKNVKIGLHKTIILPMVLYECETLPLALREERRYLRTGL
jgi:hypothetical protein